MTKVLNSVSFHKFLLFLLLHEVCLQSRPVFIKFSAKKMSHLLIHFINIILYSGAVYYIYSSIIPGSKSRKSKITFPTSLMITILHYRLQGKMMKRILNESFYPYNIHIFLLQYFMYYFCNFHKNFS